MKCGYKDCRRTARWMMTRISFPLCQKCFEMNQGRFKRFNQRFVFHKL